MNNKKIPIIFIHYGDSNYLKYTLKFAVIFNPDKVIILLGDGKNKKYEKMGVKHFYFKNYDSGTETNLFNKVFKFVAGKEQTKTYWVNFSFKKWFYLYNFIKKQNIEKFWMFDSDTLILSPLSRHEEKYSKYDCTEQCNGWCMKGFFSNKEIIKKYLEKINELFQSPPYLEKQRKDFEDNPTFAFTEMRAYNTYKKETFLKNIMLNKVINNETFDECFNQKHNMETEYSTRANRIVKKLYLKNKKIYEKDLETGKLAKVNTLNMSWVNIGFIQEIYLYALYGKIPYYLAKTKNYIKDLRWKIIPFIKNSFYKILVDTHKVICIKKSFYGFNTILHKMALNGIGVLNNGSNKVTGEKDFIKKFFSPEEHKVVFDIGGNVGNYSKEIKQVSPNNKIYSFEPHPKTFVRLKETAQKNNFKAFNFGFGNRNEKIKIYDYANQDGSSHASLYSDVITQIHKGKVTEHEITIKTIDSFVEENNIKKIDLLKIDTEGNEFNVLKGAQKTIDSGKIQTIHFEFNEMNTISRVFFIDFYEILKKYDFYRMLPDGLVPLRNYNPVRYEIFAYQNIVAIKKK